MTKFDKYLDRKNAPMPQGHLDILQEGKEISAASVLQRNEVNKLLNSGYLASENGFFRQEDGSTYVAVLTKMPKVTLAMIDWWFWWHAAESVRYRIWYPEMHFDNDSDFGGHYDDETKTYKERLHLSTHFVTEDIGLGKEKIIINFMSPSEFGFDINKLNPENETIICAKVGSPKTGVWAVEMCHFVRVTDDGVEMRSRFWMGHQLQRMGGFGQAFLNVILNKSFVKRNLIPKEIGHHMFHHCSQEYHNLGAFLPELYQEEMLV